MMALERRGEGQRQYERRADRISRCPFLVSYKGMVVSKVSESIAILGRREVRRRNWFG